jgi:hypothetical protein
MGVGTRFIASHGGGVAVVRRHHSTPQDAINRVPTAMDIAVLVSEQKSYAPPDQQGLAKVTHFPAHMNRYVFAYYRCIDELVITPSCIDEFVRRGHSPIGIKLRANLSPPRVIEDGKGVWTGDAGDKLASPARGASSAAATRAPHKERKAIPGHAAGPVWRL